MNNIDIYYDNHTEEEFLELLPQIITEFIRVLKLFYYNNCKFHQLVYKGKKYEEQVSLENIKEIMNLDRSQAFSPQLVSLVYGIHYLSDNKETSEHEWIGVDFESSYKRVSITPGLIEKFDSNMVKHEKRKLEVFQLELFDALISKTDPSYINTSLDQFCDAHYPSAEYEYVKDPYWFTVELMRKRDSSTNEHCINKTDGQWELKEEIKKIMTIKEIVDICHEYAKHKEGYYIKYYSGTGGVARFSIDNYSAHYPRFFIREELRKRGVSIPEGTSERHMQLSFSKPWREKK